ncbi:hypothetical protein Tco_0561428 [Tanacetum coccineum]
MIDDDEEYSIQFNEYLENSSKAITPDLPTEEPGNSLSMGDEHLSTILETESDEVIKSSVEDLVPIPSESKGISEDICDVPFSDNDHFDAEFGLIDSLLSRDISITSPKIDFLPEEFAGELDLIDPILSGIDEDNFDEDFLSPSRITRSGSTTTHAKNSLPEYDSFLFEIKPDQEGLISVVDLSDNSNDSLLELPEFESFHFDPSFPRPPPESPDVEICFNFEPDAPMINNFDALNKDECFYPGGDSPLLLSTGSEDTIFDPDIST